MVDDKDDQALNEYLQGDSNLSRQYHAASKDTPPKHLDDAILAAARKSAGPHSRLLPSFMQQWGRPLKFAAVVVICVSLVIAIYDDEGHLLLTGPEKSLPDTTPLQPGDKSDQTLSSQAGEFIEQSNKDRGSTSEGQAAVVPSEPPPVDDSEKTAGKMIWEKKKQTDTRDALQKEQGVPPAKNRIEEESLDLMQEKPAPVLKRELSTPMITEQDVPSASGLVTGRNDSEWLTEISRLWQSGNTDQAVASLEKFLQVYPDYPHDELLKQLPEDFNPAEYIEGFDPD
ncbi:MAG TPA: hypothetical protein VLN56_01540 [Gammaproteobacteria bacterium]|nr:hypothetical protein [Gammaproteobacteria bacterium]